MRNGEVHNGKQRLATSPLPQAFSRPTHPRDKISTRPCYTCCKLSYFITLCPAVGLVWPGKRKRGGAHLNGPMDILDLLHTPRTKHLFPHSAPALATRPPCQRALPRHRPPLSNVWPAAGGRMRVEKARSPEMGVSSSLLLTHPHRDTTHAARLTGPPQNHATKCPGYVATREKNRERTTQATGRGANNS